MSSQFLLGNSQISKRLVKEAYRRVSSISGSTARGRVLGKSSTKPFATESLTCLQNTCSSISTRLFHTSSTSSKSVNPDTFMSGSNSVYVDEMYRAWKVDPQSVHKSWDAYFNALESGTSTEMSFIPAPGLQSGSEEYLNLAKSLPTIEQSDSLGLSYLIRAYQVRGHEIANLDPLGLHTFRPANPPKELDITFHGFSESDLDRPMRMKGTSYGGHKGFLYDLSLGPEVTLRTVLDTLRRTYCQTLGVEYMHMTSREKCNWIRTRVESPSWLTYTKEKKTAYL